MESCGMTAIKYLLFLFNAVFAILGILIIAAASYDIDKVREFTSMGEDVSGIETDILLIIIGILILVIAAFGCFGAIKESPKLLYMFAGCLILIVILELSVGIAAAALRPQMETTVKRHLRESFVRNKADTGRRVFWDGLQKNLKCCGVIGPEDYNEVSNNTPLPPASCCPRGGDLIASSSQQAQQVENVRRSECVTQKKYYMVGCEDKILETVHGAGLAVIITGIVFCFLEVIGILLAIWLAQAIKQENKTEPESGSVE